MQVSCSVRKAELKQIICDRLAEEGVFPSASDVRGEEEEAEAAAMPPVAGSVSAPASTFDGIGKKVKTCV